MPHPTPKLLKQNPYKASSIIIFKNHPKLFLCLQLVLRSPSGVEKGELWSQINLYTNALK
jgi:hypothetical protein